MGLVFFVWDSEWNLFRIESSWVVLMPCGVGTGLALEYFIAKHHYRSGIDDALLYFTLMLLIVGLSLLFNSSFEEQLLDHYVLAFPVLLAGSIRYADRLVAILLRSVCW
jgi:hypothetical protein